MEWLEQIDETLRQDTVFKDIPDVNTLAKNYKSTKELVGKKGIILPNEDDQEGWGKVYDTLGRPKEAKEYEKPELTIDEKVKPFIDETKIEKFKELAHKQGLTKKQFKSLVKEYTESQAVDIKNHLESQERQVTALNDALTAKWGSETEKNNAVLQKALDAFGKDMDQEAIKALAGNPYAKELIVNMAKVISEDSFIPGGKGTSEIEQLQAESKQIWENKAGPFWNNTRDDSHNLAVKRYNEIQNRIMELSQKSA